MNMKKNILMVLISVFATISAIADNVNYRVIPLPQEITDIKGSPFVLSSRSVISYPAGNEKMKRNASFLASYLKEVTGKNYVISSSKNGNIILCLGLSSSNDEAYKLRVTDKTITIKGSSEAGVFYGIQTLRKSLPLTNKTTIHFPRVEINDMPHFAYRGMMLDVSRHFFSVDDVKKYIDILALHNVNRFHWHLTDDQGWRIEIKKYPRLTEYGSWRDSTVIGHNSGKYDGKPYGGFYTQEQAKEIVKYAADRYITVIPEIDMPGHMLGALTAYPELGCTGGPYHVWGQWGVSENVLCAGNDKVLDFIDGVLGELIKIFPSEYIHVGGDECPRTMWKQCPKCQARIRQLGLKSDSLHSAEDRLESFLIDHAEKFLNSHGRRMIGWDEILDGDVAQNATVMSWRGMSGGIKAAKMGHDVIMSPDPLLYFDHYQTKDIKDEPIAIGGYLPVSMVYGENLVPDELTAQEKKHIIGLQANLWSEYIPKFSQAEYMVMPRIAALSEIQWTENDKRNYNDFLKRLPHLCAIYDKEGYTYSKHVFDLDVNYKVNHAHHCLDVALATVDHAPVHYTLDGSEPTSLSPLVKDTLKIKDSCILKAVVVRSSGNSKVYTQKIDFNKASLKPIKVNQPIYKDYYAQGPETLVDGLCGDNNYSSGRWIGFSGDDLDAVIDLLESTEISQVSIHTLVDKASWVFDARKFVVDVSNDGVNFKHIASEDYLQMKESDADGIKLHKLSFTPVNARYVKVMLESEHSLPSWFTGAVGKPGFLFADEITII